MSSFSASLSPASAQTPTPIQIEALLFKFPLLHPSAPQQPSLFPKLAASFTSAKDLDIAGLPSEATTEHWLNQESQRSLRFGRTRKKCASEACLQQGLGQTNEAVEVRLLKLRQPNALHLLRMRTCRAPALGHTNKET